MLKIAQILGLLAVSLAAASCGQKSNAPPTKPTAPLSLAEPAALPERLGETDLKNMDSDELFMLSRSAANQKSYHVAAVAQYWRVQKAHRGQYDLACYLAQTGKVDAAFYWLQIAAIEDGVDTAHAQRDEDLESLRRDPRWSQVLQYMQDCNKYFESAPISRTVLILPTDYQTPTPIPAVLWLHGMGSEPEGFVNDGAQEFADELNVALIGVSGTKARGPRSFVWADDVEQNAGRLRDAIAEVSDRVTIKEGEIITLGFSQGAQAGLEVAVRYPKEYAGSIVMSPGANPQLEKLKPSPLLKRRGFVLCCAADEHPGNVQLTAMDADWLRRAKAFVIHKAYPGVSAHALPADFNERFGDWVKFFLKAREK
jgi:predicted esterase